jgi:hypothetical protein
VRSKFAESRLQRYARLASVVRQTRRALKDCLDADATAFPEGPESYVRSSAASRRPSTITA